MDTKSLSFEKAERTECLKSPKPAEVDKQAPVVLSAKEGYRIWSLTYDMDPNPLLSLEMRTLIGNLDDIAGKVFIDVACGTSRWMVRAVEMGARAFGLDLSSEMLDKARPKPGIAGCLIQADACCLPLIQQCADIVICSFAIGYVLDPEPLLNELSRITRRGGTVMISDIHPEALKAGWRRTFRGASDLFEIENHFHTYRRLREGCINAGLELKEVFEPCFGEPEHMIIRSVGKDEMISRTSNVPAILASVWQRP